MHLKLADYAWDFLFSQVWPVNGHVVSMSCQFTGSTGRSPLPAWAVRPREAWAHLGTTSSFSILICLAASSFVSSVVGLLLCIASYKLPYGYEYATAILNGGERTGMKLQIQSTACALHCNATLGTCMIALLCPSLSTAHQHQSSLWSVLSCNVINWFTWLVKQAYRIRCVSQAPQFCSKGSLKQGFWALWLGRTWNCMQSIDQ